MTTYRRNIGEIVIAIASAPITTGFSKGVEMDYQLFTKKLVLPAGFKAPAALEYEELRAKPLSKADLDADLAAVNSSVDIIHQSRGGTWPEGQITEAYNFQDLVWHEREFREGSSFAYVVYDADSRYIGCFYLNPMGHSGNLTEELARYDVDVDWWVTTDAYAQGYYQKLYSAVEAWLAKDFPFSNIHYANALLPD
ncbi:GNAT family N-acetyltransferase [Jatrophihabitans sp. DSM 45814]